jgi:hypothetical protein
MDTLTTVKVLAVLTATITQTFAVSYLRTSPHQTITQTFAVSYLRTSPHQTITQTFAVRYLRTSPHQTRMAGAQEASYLSFLGTRTVQMTASLHQTLTRGAQGESYLNSLCMILVLMRT